MNINGFIYIITFELIEVPGHKILNFLQFDEQR